MPLPSSHTAIKAKETQKQKTAHHTPGDAGEDLPIEATGGRASALLGPKFKGVSGRDGMERGQDTHSLPLGEVFSSHLPLGS